MSMVKFGTNGVRGIINEDLTPALALQMGKAIGKVYGGRMAIATDTRVSADMIRSAVASGLMSVGVDVLDLGVLPTPAIQYYVKTHDDVTGGVMITASHNPPAFNGIKCISYDGTEASRMEEENIENLYDTSIPCVPWSEVGQINEVSGVADVYVEAVISKVDSTAIREAKLTACVDCANGAAFYTTPLLLSKLGVRAVTINGNPQGEFPGHESEPTPDNLSDLMTMTREIRANIGIAHDGDADRCVFITSEGEYVSGDKSLALLAKKIISSKKGGKVYTPVATSMLVEEVVKENGGQLIYTAVGSPVVARRMIEGGGVFGGEENGGLIFPEMQYCRDGAMALAVMLETIVKQGPLSKQIAQLPVYCTCKEKIRCPNELKNDLKEYFRNSESNAEVDLTDGIRLNYSDGWVLLRPSGTEPIFRIYSESKNPDVANARVQEFMDKAKRFVSLKSGIL